MSEPRFLVRVVTHAPIRGGWIDVRCREGDGPYESSPGDAMTWLDAKLFVLARMAEHPCQIVGHELVEWTEDREPLWEDFVPGEGL